MVKPKHFLEIAGRLLRNPAAPYHEHAVQAEVRAICAEHGLRCEVDDIGNVFVRLPKPARTRPFVLAAHMDHPGFDITDAPDGNKLRARFLGGVPDAFFKAGTPLRIMPGGESARLGKRLGKEKDFELLAANPVPEAKFAVWELEDFAVRDGRIHARACDDLIGVACILATLIELKRTNTPANVIGVISRAEEVGFHGALTVAAGKQLPKDSVIVSLETSKELPGVNMGAGVILRVGDRASIFDSAATRFLGEVATELKTQHKAFEYQRALMGGGTCEATAYQEFGYQTCAVCVALGNYHNCGPKDRIAAEYVSLSDACAMTDLLVAAGARMKDFNGLTGKLPVRLKTLLGEAQKEFRRRGPL